MRIWLSLIVIAIAGAILAGCQAPCDRRCDSQAEYINACVEDAKEALAADRTPQIGWEVYENPDDWWTEGYGVAGVDELAAACKEDADARLAELEGDDRSLMEQECEDEALVFEEAALIEGSPTCHIIP